MTADKPGSGEVGARTAELWLVDLARAAPVLERLEREQPRLSAAEHDAIAARADARERRRRFGAHVALRLLIERVLGTAARGTALVRQAGGKPRLDAGDHQLAFSLSYADDLALIGLAR